jgi:Tfp pilus assembly protein PilF
VERWLLGAIDKSPRSANLLVCLADLRDLQGRYLEAEKLYRQAVAADPRNVVALNNLAYLLALQGNQSHEALKLLGEAIAVAGPTPELLDTRALVQLKLGQPQSAIKDLEDAIADSPLPPLCYHLAQAHHLARNAGAARAALRQAKALGLQADQLHALERPAYQQLQRELESR